MDPARSCVYAAYLIPVVAVLAVGETHNQPHKLEALAVPMVPMVLRAMVMAGTAKVPPPVNLAKPVLNYMLVAVAVVAVDHSPIVALAVLAAAEPEKIRAEMVMRAPLIQAVAVVAVVTRLIIQIPLLAARAAPASLSSARPRIKEVTIDELCTGGKRDRDQHHLAERAE